LAAAAGTLGFPAAAWFVLFTFVCGGFIALLFSAARGTLAVTFANVRGLALPMFAGVQPAQISAGTSMPYALAICAGALLTLVTSGFVPHLRF
jgi:Flp pilus assembly protein protease CpaA